MPVEARLKKNNDMIKKNRPKWGPVLIFASEENTLRTSLLQHQRLVVGGPLILEDCFKGLARVVLNVCFCFIGFPKQNAKVLWVIWNSQHLTRLRNVSKLKVRSCLFRITRFTRTQTLNCIRDVRTWFKCCWFAVRLSSQFDDAQV